MFDFIYTALALVAYGGAFWYLFIHLMAKSKPNRALLAILLILGLSLHGVTLYHNMITDYGINYDVFNIISFTSALMLLLSLGFSCYRPILPLNLLGIPVAMVGAILGISFELPNQILEPHSFGLDIHIMLSLAAYAVLLMTTIHAILMWLQNRELKKKQKRLWVNLLPSVQTMDHLLFDLIITGFATLTIALVVGLFTFDNFFAQHLAHKTFFATLSWLVYGTLLIGHYFWGWRGKKTIHFTIIAFILLALGFIGSKIVLEMILGR